MVRNTLIILLTAWMAVTVACGDNDDDGDAPARAYQSPAGVYQAHFEMLHKECRLLASETPASSTLTVYDRDGRLLLDGYLLLDNERFRPLIVGPDGSLVWESNANGKAVRVELLPDDGGTLSGLYRLQTADCTLQARVIASPSR